MAQKFFRTFDTSFDTKNDVKKWCLRNYFQIPRALSELPANWSGLTSLGLVRFENNFNGTTFHHHFCVKTGVKCPEEFFWYSLTPETYSDHIWLMYGQMGDFHISRVPLTQISCNSGTLCILSEKWKFSQDGYEVLCPTYTQNLEPSLATTYRTLRTEGQSC